MNDMIERAAAAIEAQPQTQTCPTVGRDATTYARAALLAALDPHDSALQNVILGAMGFFCTEGGDFGPMARVQAHDAIEAMRKAASQGENRPDRVQARRHPVVP